MKLMHYFPIVFMTLFAVSVANAQNGTIRVETDLVTVNVAIVDRQGKPVRGLRQENFEVFDNKTKQQIEYCSGETSPVGYGIVYDMHPTTSERMTAVLDSLRAFTKNLPAEDRFLLSAFNHYGSLNLEFIPTLEQIEKNLNFANKTREPASLYDAIFAAAGKLREVRTQKKTLLIISDGADHNSRHSLSDLSRQLKSFDVQIYAVIFDESRNWSYTDITRGDNRQTRVAGDATAIERAAIQDLTLKSGGATDYPAAENSVGLYRIYNGIAQEMREFYTLSFYPSEAANGKWHNLRINLREVEGSRKFALTYQQGYQSPLPKR